MPDNKNPPENEEEKISRVGEIIECEHPDCTNWALSLSSYCWKHTEDKEGYRKKIENWARKGKSLERFILIDADLSGAGLWRTNLSLSLLTDADLSEARLWDANLCGACLVGAILTNAQFNGANLTGAIDLSRENFSEQLTKKEKKDAEKFKGSYRTVKNYFIQSGLYDDASWAAFRERTLERIAWYNEIKDKGVKGLFYWSWWKTVRKWIGSHIFNLLCGYGEKPFSALRTSVAIVIFFSVIHYIFKWIQSYPKELLHWWDYLYFSIVTFTTLGYGDIRPMPAPGARMVASGEAFIGAFMIALFVWTLARRYVAR